MNKREKALEMYRNGFMKASIARELDVPPPTISMWLADFPDKWDVFLSYEWLRKPIRRTA